MIHPTPYTSPPNRSHRAGILQSSAHGFWNLSTRPAPEPYNQTVQTIRWGEIPHDVSPAVWWGEVCECVREFGHVVLSVSSGSWVPGSSELCYHAVLPCGRPFPAHTKYNRVNDHSRKLPFLTFLSDALIGAVLDKVSLKLHIKLIMSNKIW